MSDVQKFFYNVIGRYYQDKEYVLILDRIVINQCNVVLFDYRRVESLLDVLLYRLLL